MAVVFAAALAGCGGPSSLQASAFQSAPPATYAGLTADTMDQVQNQPTWRQNVRTGDRLTASVLLRNTSKGPVTITGQGKGDRSRDGIWVPDAVEGAPVRIGPGEAVRVTFIGHAVCTPDLFGAYTFGRTDVAYGGSTQDIDLHGRLELDCNNPYPRP